MRSGIRVTAAFLALGLLAAGCEALQRSSGAGGEAREGRTGAGPAALKRITVAVMGEPDILTGARIPGTDAFQQLVHAGLTTVDNQGSVRAQLAESVPSLENGLWVLLPDGRMETTWRIKRGSEWHDGVPFTSEDLVFTARVTRDPELPIARDPAWDLVESIEAPDPVTVTIGWRKPFIRADTMFSFARGRAFPLPRHLLEKPYTVDKPSFAQLPYWAEEFTGAGPYRLREWVRGSHVVLSAVDRYVLGRAKIDEIEVKFIPDPNTLVANIIAGAVDVTLGRALSLEPSLQVRDQWRDGRMDLRFTSWIVIYPQFINPSPSVVGDPRFRKALMHALDREQMADTLNAGLVPLAHTFLSPNEAEYKEIEGEIVRYNYDVREAALLIEGLGYTRSPDGSFRDAANQRLSIELRTSAELDIHHKAIAAVADHWQHLGLSVDQVIMPPQRMRDDEYRATFPGFTLFRQGNDVDSLTRLYSSRTPLPGNNFRVTGNHSRYMNPEFDVLIDQYFTTIPRDARVRVLGQIVHHTTDRLNLMGLFYDTETTMIANRLVNVTGRHPASSQAWNAHEWELP